MGWVNFARVPGPARAGAVRLTSDDRAHEGGVAGAVDQRHLQPRLFRVGLGGHRAAHARRQRHQEAREAQVERDAALAALRLLVEGRRGRRGAQRPRQRRLAAVDVAQHAHVHVHPPPGHRAAAAAYTTRPRRGPSANSLPLQSTRAAVRSGPRRFRPSLWRVEEGVARNA